MHPATRILNKLGPTPDLEDEWWFVYCLLELLVEYDPRPAMSGNPVEDVYDRVRETGVSESGWSFVLLRQKLARLHAKYEDNPVTI